MKILPVIDSDIKIRQAQEEIVNRNISVEEFDFTVKRMENEKTPGGDGLPADDNKVFFGIKLNQHYMKP